MFLLGIVCIYIVHCTHTRYKDRDTYTAQVFQDSIEYIIYCILYGYIVY